MNLNLNQFNWYVLHYAKKLGLWGWLGLLLLAISWGFYQIKVVPMKDATQKLLQEKQAQAFNQTQQAPKVSLQPKQQTQQDLDAFYAQFPQLDQLPEVLSSMNKLAVKQHVALNSGEYKLDKIKQNNQPIGQVLTKYKITFPIKGQYQDIRAFVSQVLARLPAIGISDMQVKRENTTDSLVEARLNFVLYVKGKQ